MLEGVLGSHHLCFREFWVYTLFKCSVPGSDEDWVLKMGLPEVNFLTFWFIASLHGLHQIYPKFTQSLRQTEGFFWGKPFRLKTVNFV